MAPAADNTLQSISYNRGSLQLLDQVTPFFSIIIYFFIPIVTSLASHHMASFLGCALFNRESSLLKLFTWILGTPLMDVGPLWSYFYTIVRHAIKDMVVRGAPAIAIAAALSLAVEVSNLEGFDETINDAVSYLTMKLDYLVSSRPTAVNLSDAATKLKEVISNAAATASEAKSVFQAYVDAAEIMLEDDVASNKAIGSFGANFILHQQINDPKKLSVLTHCNTGSLATAGFGTALGVIRALHTEGVLEKAYCTETRPFNQGSRLTAFELVHEKIPATLIADSAAAALMKDGRVNAVVVGADRVAANGDTANKIGTYSLALIAKHHNVPFFVAAPLTSIDLSLSSGKEIVIEERSPKELLNSRGGLGEQIAASGISVWNPAFDVTPANLITGIITEKGVITKVDAEDFDIKGFVRKVAG